MQLLNGARMLCVRALREVAGSLLLHVQHTEAVSEQLLTTSPHNHLLVHTYATPLLRRWPPLLLSILDMLLSYS